MWFIEFGIEMLINTFIIKHLHMNRLSVTMVTEAYSSLAIVVKFDHPWVLLKLVLLTRKNE